uniref:Poly [ADP-ribose] polymerase n=1 Tax=Eptatretus burgeri TaxID=7764 RepID=A0A8C4WPJ9_EPTBU
MEQVEDHWLPKDHPSGPVCCSTLPAVELMSDLTWPTDESDGEAEAESEEFCFPSQLGEDGESHRHPQLEADIEMLKEKYGENAIVIREYGSIDDISIDLLVNVSFLDDEIATAWKVLSNEAIVIRLHFCLSQYLDGPDPSVEVFQPSNKDNFGIGLQLKKVLRTFVSQQWKHLNNESLQNQHSKGLNLLRSNRIGKKLRSPLSLLTHLHRPQNFLFHPDVGMRGKRSLEPDGPPQHANAAKTLPTLEHGFLVQTMLYATQRIPTLNEFCVVCDEPHVFQNGPMLKPAVCARELCVFAFQTLGVMTGAAAEVATGPEVVDLLLAMCRSALESPRKSIIFDPYPSVVDPNDHKSLAFNPKKKNYERLQKALDSIMSIREMTQGSYMDIKKQMDKQDHLAHPLLQWVISSNRSHIVKLHSSRQLSFMHTPHQFLLLSSPPAKEARFRAAKKLYGSSFAFHGSHTENWHSILRNGLVNASYTKLQLHGAAYGKGIYLSPISSISFGYSGMGKGQHRMESKNKLVQNCNRLLTTSQMKMLQARFLQSRNLNCIALCEVITSKDLQKHGNIWVCPMSDHVCTRFFFVYEDGQVGDANINTQDHKVQVEILRILGTQSLSL